MTAAARARHLLWRAVLALTGGLTVRGTLPSGGCVVVANHSSHADTAALLAALPPGCAPRFAAAADYWFDGGWRTRACRRLGAAFPVRRTGGGSADIAAAVEVLRAGGTVVVYPEGTRGDGAPAPFHAGAFRLAETAGVPVVPVGLRGTSVLLPKHGRIRRHRVHVWIGEAMAPDPRAARAEVARLAGHPVGNRCEHPAPRRRRHRTLHGCPRPVAERERVIGTGVPGCNGGWRGSPWVCPGWCSWWPERPSARAAAAAGPRCQNGPVSSTEPSDPGPDPEAPSRDVPPRLVFRHSALGILAALVFLVCALPLMLSVPFFWLVVLAPIAFTVWLLRLRTTVDGQTVTTRTVVGSRSVAWDDISALRLGKRSGLIAVLGDDSSLRLPAVHLRDLPALAVASGGRVPDPTGD